MLPLRNWPAGTHFVARSFISIALAGAVLASVILGHVSPVLAESGWGTAQLIDTQDASSTSPAVAKDGSNAVAVWRHHDGGDYQIRSNHSTDGGITWANDQAVDGPASTMRHSPQVALSGSSAVAVWHISGEGVHSSHSSDGGATWSSPQSIDSGNGTDPQVAISGSTAVAVWHEYDGDDWGIYTNYSQDGGNTWGTPQRIESYSQMSMQEHQRIAIDGANVVVVWWSNEDGTWIKRIHAVHSSDGGETWDTPEIISESEAVDSYSPHVAMSGTSVVAVWRDTDTPNIYSNRSDDGGATWLGAQTLDDGSAGGKQSPCVAISGSTAIAVWDQYDGSKQRTHAICSQDAGATWNDERIIDDGVGSGAGSAQVALSGMEAVAVWLQTDNGVDRVYGSHSSDGGVTWEEPQLVQDDVAQSSSGARLASGSDAVAVWHQFVPGGALIYSNHFMATQPADSPWPMFGQNPQRTGTSPYTGLEIAYPKWSFATDSWVTSSPAIGVDGTVYVGSGDTRLYAIDPADGSEKWRFTTDDTIRSSPAIGADGTIYVGSMDGNLYAVNPDDGSEKWRFTTGGGVQSSPTIGTSGTIYVGSNDGTLYAIDPTVGSEKWRFTTSLGIQSSPAIGPDGTIYVGSLDWNLYAVNPDDGSEDWRFTTGEGVYSSPAIGADGTIYVASWDGNLYAVNPDGDEEWSFPTASFSYSSPAIGADGTIYVGCANGNVHAVNPDDGSEKWCFATTGGWVVSSPAIGADGTIYVGSGELLSGHLHAIDPDDGSEKWRFATEGSVDSSPAIGDDGTIYVGSGDYRLYAIGDEFALELHAGWNLTSIPVIIGGNTVAEVFEGIDGVVAIYEWDSHSKTYGALTHESVIDPLRAYWVAMESTPASQMQVRGVPITVNDWEVIDLSAGWHMIGGPYSKDPIDIGEIWDGGTNSLGDIYYWDAEEQRYEEADELVLGQGYWMKISSMCTLTIGPPIR